MRICLYDHHNYVIPTDGIGGVIGLFQILYSELKNKEVDLTIIVNDLSTIENDKNFKVIKLPFSEIENIRYGRVPISKYFNGDIFFSNSSGRHVNFDFKGFNGKWVSMCHGCQEWVGGSECQIFVSNNQLKQHFNDNLFDEYCNNYHIMHGVVDTKRLYYEDGPHDRIVWMGRIDGAKAERLYEISKNVNEKILIGGWYSEEWEWLFKKIISTGNVEYVGFIRNDFEKREFYKRAKISIHCSTFEDPCPTTILEAQACGIPVATYANGAIKEINYHQNLIFNELKTLVDFLNGELSFTYDKKLLDFIEKNFDKSLYGNKFLNIIKNI